MGSNITMPAPKGSVVMSLLWCRLHDRRPVMIVFRLHKSSPADEATGDEEDAGVGRHKCVHAAGCGDGQKLVDDERAREGHQHRELRRHDAPGAGQVPRQQIPCRVNDHIRLVEL